MSLLNIKSVLTTVLNSLEKVPLGRGIEMLSYKRDRGVSVIKEEENKFLVKEHGFQEKTWEIEKTGLEKLLKTVMKREFPRSRKLRVQKTSIQHQ